MSKFYYLPVAAALSMLMASCSQEEMPELRDGSMTTFTVSIPGELGSRFGDGLAARSLFVAIYDGNADEGVAPLFSNFAGDDPNMSVNATGSSTDAAQTWTVSVPLVKNKSYDLVFWAQNGNPAVTAEAAPNGNAIYSYNPNTRNIIVNYDGYAAYDENRDAFYKTVTFESKGVDNGTYQLTRPFSQINIGTSDYEAYKAADGVTSQVFGMTVTGVSNCINLMNNSIAKVNNFEGKVVVPVAEPSSTPLSANNTDYTYLAMGYFLVGDAQSSKGNVGVTLNMGTAGTEFANYGSSVPAQMNYRTNIIGKLLTNPESFTITLDTDFEPEDLVYPDKWDGTTTKKIEPTTRLVGGVKREVYAATNGAELAWLAEQSNVPAETSELPADAYIVLDSDIDLDSHEWTPLGYTGRSSSTMTTPFSGTFDGNGHTIKNLTSSTTASDMPAGLIGVANDATVKNVTVSGGHISSSDSGAAIVAVMLGTTEVSNCHSEGVSISANGAAGGVVGRAYGISNTISGCTNSSTITLYPGAAKTKVGGIVGIASAANSQTTISGCINTASVDGGADGTGGICGYIGSNATLSNCINSGAVAQNSTAKYGGGILGYLNANTTTANIINSENKAPVAGNNAGGIFGSIGSYATINISGTNNSGAVTAVAVAGGIAAVAGDGLIDNCINTAAVSATASNGIAGGVVGQDNRGNIFDCQGGSAAITAPIAGRVLGAAHCGYNYVNQVKLIAEGNSYENGLPTVGSIGVLTTFATLEVLSGELIGAPKAGENGNDNILIREGASWDLFPGETGKWLYNKTANTWVKQ